MKLECQANPLYWNDTPRSYCPTMQPVCLIGVVLPIHQSSQATRYANQMLKHPVGLSGSRNFLFAPARPPRLLLNSKSSRCIPLCLMAHTFPYSDESARMLCLSV